MIDEPWDVFLYRIAQGAGPLARLVAEGMAGVLGEGITPILAGAVVFLQNLKAHCPEAFDAAGNLRPEWQAIVQLKLAAMRTTVPVASSPRFHLELATRRICVCCN